MTNIFRVMVFLFAATAIYAQPQVSSQGDDWRLVAYNFARVNNYNIDDKEVTMTRAATALWGRSGSRIRAAWRSGLLPER
jgi:hypothetical protein